MELNSRVTFISQKMKAKVYQHSPISKKNHNRYENIHYRIRDKSNIDTKLIPDKNKILGFRQEHDVSPSNLVHFLLAFYEFKDAEKLLKKIDMKYLEISLGKSPYSQEDNADNINIFSLSDNIANIENKSGEDFEDAFVLCQENMGLVIKKTDYNIENYKLSHEKRVEELCRYNLKLERDMMTFTCEINDALNMIVMNNIGLAFVKEYQNESPNEIWLSCDLIYPTQEESIVKSALSILYTK